MSTPATPISTRANRLARRLIDAGVGTGSRVGVRVRRSARFAASVLAVMKAGGAYVPLDPTLPSGRLAFMVSDSDAAVLITDIAPPDGVSCLVISPDTGPDGGPDTGRAGSDASAELLTGNPAPRATPSDLAYVLYTSGSTGVPKGVMVEHRAVVNFIAAVQELFEITPADRVLQFASPGFDVSVFEMFGALLSGARLVLPDEEQRRSPACLTVLMRDAGVTVTDLPPSMMGLLDGDQFPALRITFVGGGAFAAELVRCWARPAGVSSTGTGRPRPPSP